MPCRHDGGGQDVLDNFAELRFFDEESLAFLAGSVRLVINDAIRLG